MLFVIAAAYYVWATKNRPGREESVYADGRAPAVEAADEGEGGSAVESAPGEASEDSSEEPSDVTKDASSRDDD
ncbi:hypothetical protein D9M69_704720 [compost metagenome]